MKLVEDQICCFYNSEQENFIHVYWESEVVKTFWKRLKDYISDKCSEYVTFTKYSILIGGMDNDSLMNHIILAGKIYIHLSSIKNGKLSLDNFLKIFSDMFKTEIFIANKNQNILQFERKWLRLNNLFS